jgi:hypothetical protein
MALWADIIVMAAAGSEPFKHCKCSQYLARVFLFFCLFHKLPNATRHHLNGREQASKPTVFCA